MAQKPIAFEGLRGLFYYERVAYRPPRKGEYYLSGAIVAAWRAPNGLLAHYHIVRPLRRANV